MDPAMLVMDHMDIYKEFKDAGEYLSTDQVIELQKVQALEAISRAIILLGNKLDTMKEESV